MDFSPETLCTSLTGIVPRFRKSINGFGAASFRIPHPQPISIRLRIWGADLESFRARQQNQLFRWKDEKSAVR
jgi:hypothetical protein